MGFVIIRGVPASAILPLTYIMMTFKMTLVMTLTVTLIEGAPSCPLKLSDVYRDMAREGVRNADPGDKFREYVLEGVNSVFFHVYWDLGDGKVIPLNHTDITGTYTPNMFVWAVQQGINVLHLPVDAGILSLGLMGIEDKHMSILLHPTGITCMDSRSKELFLDSIVRFLLLEIVDEPVEFLRMGSGQKKVPGVICRSAIGFVHPILRARGTGYKCCSVSKRKTRIECDIETVQEWYVFWNGPLFLLVWIYLAGCLYFFSIYRDIRSQKVAASPGTHFRMLDLLRETVDRISDRLGKLSGVGLEKRLNNRGDLVPLNEEVTVIDVVGVSKETAIYGIHVFNKIVVALFVIVYYYLQLVMISSYADIQAIPVIPYSKEVYMNVFGHLGWLFADKSLLIFYYALAETIFSLTAPIVYVVLYLVPRWGAQRSNPSPKSEKTSKSEPKSETESKSEPLAGEKGPDYGATGETAGDRDVEAASSDDGEKSALAGDGDSGTEDVTQEQEPTGDPPPRRANPLLQILQTIWLVMVWLYFFFVVGPALAYIAFFICVALFGNVETLITVMMPLWIVLALLYYILSNSNVILGASLHLYRGLRQVLLDLIEEDFPELVERNAETGVRSVPRSLVTSFMSLRQGEVMFKAFKELFSPIAVCILLVLVMLGMQMPYPSLLGNTGAVVGMQMVVLLPMIIRIIMYQNPPTFEGEFDYVRADAYAYINNYVRERGDVIKQIDDVKEENEQ